MAESNSVQPVEIVVSYIKQSRRNGKLEDVTEFTIEVDNSRTLGEAIFDVLPDEDEGHEHYDFRCHPASEGQQGSRDSISMQCKPREIEYIMDSLSNGCRPVLLLYKDLATSSDKVSDSSDSSGALMLPRRTRRTASFIIQKATIGFTDDQSSSSEDSDEDRMPDAPLTEYSVAPVTARVVKGATLPRNMPFHPYPSMEKSPSDSAPRSSQTLRPQASRPTMRNVLSQVQRPASIAIDYPKLKLSKTRSMTDMNPGGVTLVSMRPIPEGEHSLAMRATTLLASGPQTHAPVISSPLLSSTATTRPEEQKHRQLCRRNGFKRRSTLGAMMLDSVHVDTEDGSTLLISCQDYTTVGELMHRVATELSKTRESAYAEQPLMLSYKCEGKEYELLNEAQFMWQTHFYYQVIIEQNKIAMKVQRARQLPESKLSVLYRISQLTGVLLEDDLISFCATEGFARISLSDQPEVQWARRVLHDHISEVIRTRDEEEYFLCVELNSRDIPVILPLKVPPDNKIEITFHYKDVFSIKRIVDIRQTAESILADVFPCFDGCGLADKRLERYTLVFTGQETYVHGKKDLLVFTEIRRCILRGEPIHLSITEKLSTTLNTPHEFTWLPVDPLSTEAPRYVDISHKPPSSRTEVSAVWDMDEELSFRIKMVENLKFVRNYQPSLVLEATLYHGTTQLCSPFSATAKIVGDRINWSERVTFSVKQKDLPKAATIMFVIRQYAPKRWPGKVRTKRTYWGLMPVFSHRGILCHGRKVISLWQMRKDGTVPEPNPRAPPVSNPHPDAVTITVVFDEPTRPIRFPSTRQESCAGFFKNHPSAKNVTVRREYRTLVENIKHNGLYRNLHTLFLMTNWADMTQVLEVYYMLDQLDDVIDCIPVEVALKFLDRDFSDETVREFAVRVLEKLPNDQLEDFLLQLTQVVKFEAHHDSALARFLLKRALMNKRIGHFFFWYLKCEMSNPQYVPRYGVILEAYLKGCGDAMLARFTNEIKMQNSLEQVGKEVKEQKDFLKMQSALPDMLRKEKMTSLTFTAVFNPRLVLGNMEPTRCKVMKSAKKPLWLEMHNVHPTGLAASPTRMILKLGDDLRQDMITLRMFSLFEKLWEEKGLDLQLIPYGCMATGPTTGFIEVVKNARTIAEVSGLRNTKKLYQWIRSNQTNQFGELDPEKLEEAVRTFTHSCAGYSVATYVLGIGDRHNDNIMVTTSGNLFHIDFGHFLGNIKYFMGFKREWAPFVLTPDFVYVMGGEGSKMFEMYKNLCCRAFATLRQHGDLIINLFSMMRSTGIPELTCVEDTDYIRMALALDQPDHTAEEIFRRIIQKCLDLKWTVQFMWHFHLMRKKNLLGTGSSSSS